MSKKIYLSPSNQSNNAYAFGDTNEMVQCNRIADYAKAALERCGFIVKKAPMGQEISVSAKESNNFGADLHIPIHTNAGGGNGTLVMIYSNASENLKAGTALYNSVNAVTPGTVEYGVRVNPSLLELNSTTAIATYVECEFHDREDLAEFIINNVDVLGEAIAEGVCDYYGVSYVQGDSSEDQNDSDQTTGETLYKVQAGAFKIKENAENLKKELNEAGFDAFISEGD